MDKEIETFRREVASWRGDQRRGGRGYPEAMKATALRLWDRLRREGASGSDAAEQVGISAASLHLWRGGMGKRRLVPVQLVREPKRPVAEQPVRLVSPKGYRIEVPDVAMAVALLRELG